MQRKHKISNALAPYAFLIPAALIFVFLLLVPLGRAFYLSTLKWDGIREPVQVGLQNFQNLFKDRIFLVAARNTAIFVLSMVLIQSTVPLLVAVLLNSGIKGSTFFRTAYFMPVIISMAISGMLWSMIYEPNFGVLNEMLRAVGLDKLTRFWLAEKWTVIPSLVLVSVWQSLGFYLVIYFAGLQNIPQELIEAAQIDGATPLRIFFKITIPLLAPVTTVVVVLNTINSLKVFDHVWVMTHGGPNNASTTFATYLYQIAFGNMGSAESKLGYASAIGLVIFIFTFILSILQVKYGQSEEIEY
ncbi:MAG: sugar ABC transporter permease [Anaerolineaceae bacterium]|nr:sugar ABC transporter permease [Anaerolineaceae bacterium]